MKLESLIIDYDKGCIVATLEEGESVPIPLNGVEFAAVSLKLKEPEYDMPTLGKKLKEFHDLLCNNLPRNNMPDWLKEFIDSPRFSKGKNHEKAASKLLSDARKKIKAQLGDAVSSALLPKSNKLMTYPLEKIRFMGRLPVYNVPVINRVPGMMLNNDGTEIDLMPEGIEGELKIPEGVTKIGGNVFIRSGKITRITIPKSVIFIDGYSFFDCKELEWIEVAEGNPVYMSINGILFNKEGTHFIRIPTKKNGEFQISESVIKIGDYAFRDCTGLTSITMPDGVTEIGRYAFEGCTGLKSITISKGITRIGSGTFSGCTGLESITIPEGVRKIEENAFAWCIGLTNITIPKRVIKIERCAFKDCIGLESITIPDGVTEIGRCAFEGCIGLESITIPEGVRKIEENAFSGCIGLTGITIPDSVTKIGENAFCRCRGLRNITIPEGVIEIARGAFWGCRALKEIYFEKDAPKLGLDTFKNVPAIVYYRKGTKGWRETFGGLATKEIDE